MNKKKILKADKLEKKKGNLIFFHNQTLYGCQLVEKKSHKRFEKKKELKEKKIVFIQIIGGGKKF